ncbi:energy-coupled thiamine transporter ThiT [Anaerovibrio sp.]|uniref:energy-coupled thiamine transporter ThiT n=1 Tax=Anaerovibrio sp. TaxID=1872532 RepID=UPI0025D76932|nr:energy-coupled thiamine transporter ThiT [Anaerovibrio sp.]
MGGTVTPCSMLFIAIIGHIYGLRTGILTGIAFGILQFMFFPYILSIPQVIVDYILAFGALGLSGLVKNTPDKLIWAYLIGCCGRLFFAVISGCLFFAYYAPEYYNSAFLYSLAYNFSYIAAEAALTVIFISLPPVKKMLQYGYDTVKDN